MQYDTTINEWHTCPEDGRINASNPCVTGETLVATAEGWQRIDALVGKTARIIGSDGVPHLVTRIFPTGHKPVFDLRTRLGYRVRITGDHKVLTVGRGDVAVADLTAGNRLMLRGPGFGRRALATELALGVGVAVAEGYLTQSVVQGRAQESLVLTTDAGESPVLAAVAEAVHAGRAALQAVGGLGRQAGTGVITRTRGHRAPHAERGLRGGGLPRVRDPRRGRGGHPLRPRHLRAGPAGPGRGAPRPLHRGCHRGQLR